MGEVYLLSIFESHYCKITFLLSLVIIYFLTPPKIFYGFYSLLGGLFILTASLIFTCLVRNIKEKIIDIKDSGASILSIIALILGYGTMQICSIGAPVCGTTIIGGILALIFPNALLNIFERYGVYILISSILIQIIALWSMNCFKKDIKKIDFKLNQIG